VQWREDPTALQQHVDDLVPTEYEEAVQVPVYPRALFSLTQAHEIVIGIQLVGVAKP